MKNTAVSTIALIAAVSSPHLVLGQADPPTSKHEHLKALEGFIGDWTLTGTITWAGEPPKPFTYRCTVKWTLGQQFIETEMTETVNGINEVRYKSLIGRDKASQAITEWAFGNMPTSKGANTWTQVVTWDKMHDSNISWVEVATWSHVDEVWRIRKSFLNGQLTVFSKDRHQYKCDFALEDGRRNSWYYVAERAKNSSTGQTDRPTHTE